MAKFDTTSRRTLFACLGLLLVLGIAVLADFQSRSIPPKITPVITIAKTQAPLSLQQKETQLALQATPTPIPSPTSFPIASPTPVATRTPKVYNNINPYTGLILRDVNDLLRRPVMVKLAAWPRSLRPFNQINQADLVLEYYNGHQTNHLLALFYTSDATAVGPLAPGRLLDARLARHYQADLVVASAPEVVEGVFANTLPNRVFYRGYAPCPGICTETEAQGGNTVVDTAAIRDFTAKDRPPRTINRSENLSFSLKIQDWDEDANRFSYLYADFSVMDWRYNPDTGKYHLWQEAEDENGELNLQPSFDRDTGEPIAFENIVFMMSNYIEYNSVTYDINLREADPNQVAIFLRDGKMTYGTWFSSNQTESFSFYSGGNPYPFKPGRSWYVFTTTFSRPESTVDGEWDLVFKLK